MKKIISLLLALLLLCSSLTALGLTAYAANYTSSYWNYTEPSGADYAYWNGRKMVKHSGTWTTNIKWMQASLNWCIRNKGLNASLLNVDGSFGPASKKATLAFQRKFGLSADGSFGPSTIKRMKDVQKGRYPKQASSSSASNGTAETSWLWPTDSRRTTCGFADNVYHTKHWHRGIDISCGNKSNVYASKSGTVACVGSDNSRGKYIVIDHGNGYYSEYQHLSSVTKEKGCEVSQGDVIAKSGNTGVGGYHLHFELWNLGTSGKNIKNANTPWNNSSQYVNVNPKNSDKVYCTKSNNKSSGLKIGQKQGGGIAKASLTKTANSAGKNVVYCYDNNGITYIFK